MKYPLIVITLGFIIFFCAGILGNQQYGKKSFQKKSSFKKVILSQDLNDPVDMDIAPNGDIYIVERKGNIKVYKFSNRSIEPVGNEEVNVTNKPGNFGWPHFNADNQPLARVDPNTNSPLGFFDPDRPINDSPNNTGKRFLPPAQPAMIWYPGGQSKQWPILDKGTRSVKAGSVYHYDENKYFSQTRLPEHYDNVLFIYDWSRNWIMSVRLDGPDHFKSIEPFMPNADFASPIDMQFGMDGALYVLEYGKNFYNNPDGKLVRIEYSEGTDDGNKSPDPISKNNNQREILVGEQLIRDNDCNNCHLLNEKSFGSSYLAITNRYNEPSNSTILQLAQKVINGGGGNWGEMSMSPHPYLTVEEAQLMVKLYIFSEGDKRRRIITCNRNYE